MQAIRFILLILSLTTSLIQCIPNSDIFELFEHPNEYNLVFPKEQNKEEKQRFQVNRLFGKTLKTPKLKDISPKVKRGPTNNDYQTSVYQSNNLTFYKVLYSFFSSFFFFLFPLLNENSFSTMA